MKKKHDIATYTTESRPSVTSSLEAIREQARTQQNTTAQTIAELEAWRADIEATIAFLKAQKQR